MQIAEASQNLSGGLSLSRTRYEQYDQFYQASRDIAVDFSESGDTVTISSRESVVYRESFYTAEGTMLSMSSPLALEEAGAALENGVAALAENAVDQYLAEIRSRVEKLIKDAADLSERFRLQVLGIQQGNAPEQTFTIRESSEQYSLYEVRSESITSVTLDTASFSAENTAARIVQFALANYDGGDRAAYAEKVRSAIMEGFDAAQMAFGGTLPDVSYKTIDLVNEALDRFAQGENIDMTA